nr:cyclase family protein [Halolamina pelagica]
MTLHDLSHPIEPGMPVYPGDPEVTVDAADTFAADGCRVSRLTCGSHTGTHVDAPAHTEADGATLDAYPVSAFVRDAVVVDCSDLDAREPIPAGRVPAAEPAPDVDCVLFRTGWDQYWGEARYRDHPYLSVVAAERCAERELAVGIDAFSPDPTPPAAGRWTSGIVTPSVPTTRCWARGCSCSRTSRTSRRSRRRSNSALSRSRSGATARPCGPSASIARNAADEACMGLDAEHGV